MNVALIPIIVALSFVFGFFFPRASLWGILFVFPLLYPANMAIIPSEILYLNVDRLSFSILLGAHLKIRHSNYKLLFNNKILKILLVFFLYVIVISISDRFINIIFTYIPNIYLAFFLSFLLINNENDYKNFLKIMSFHAMLFSIVVLLDFFYVINISLEIRKLSPGFSWETTQIYTMRAGINRVAGLDGDSIRTAARLVVLFAITLLTIKYYRNILLKIIPPFVTFISIILLMSRAGYIALIVAILFLIVLSLFYGGQILIASMKKAVQISFLVTVVIITSYFTIPFVNNTINAMIHYSLSYSTMMDVGGRVDRIPRAISYFLDNPILGYGSPHFVYFELMRTDDIPFILTYALAGGIPLLIILLLWWIRIPFNFITYLKKYDINKEDRNIILHISAGMAGGIMPMLSNDTDKHLILMIILFVGTHKYLITKYSNFSIKKMN